MRARRPLLIGCSVLAVAVGAAWFSIRPTRRGAIIAALPDSAVKEALVPEVKRLEPKTETARKIVEAAKEQIGDDYDAAYRVISYPGGDVPSGSGACTDVE